MGPSCCLEFTQRSQGTYLVINRLRSGLPMVEKVIRLSVIVPFFNVERYAAETLTSLARNAAPGIEFVVVDDHGRRSTVAGGPAAPVREEFGTIGRPQRRLVGCAAAISASSMVMTSPRQATFRHSLK